MTGPTADVVLARRRYEITVEPEGFVEFVLFTPKEDDVGSWTCQLEMSGLIERRIHFAGVDALQVLIFGLRAINAELVEFALGSDGGNPGVQAIMTDLIQNWGWTVGAR